MPTTITPALSTKIGYIEDVRDQIATLIRFLIMNPGWTSSIWEDDMISFRNMSSRYEGNRDLLCGNLAQKVQASLNRMFKDYTCSCDFTHEDFEKDVSDGRYTVKFSVFIAKTETTGTDGEQYEREPALISGDILVDPKNNDLTLSYDRTPDNFTI